MRTKINTYECTQQMDNNMNRLLTKNERSVCESLQAVMRLKPIFRRIVRSECSKCSLFAHQMELDCHESMANSEIKA